MMARNFADAEKLMIDAYNLGHRANNIEFLISNAQSQQNKDADAMTWLEQGDRRRARLGQSQ